MRLAAALLLSVAACWFIAAAGFTVGLPLTAAPVVVGILIGVVYLAWGANRRVAVGTIALFLLLTGGTFALTTLFKDFSWDGNSYHLVALQQLARGWNPFREVAPPGSEFADWLAYFSKGPWYSTTSAYLLTGSLNAAKYASLLLLAPAALIGWTLFRSDQSEGNATDRQRLVQHGFALLCAALWMLNPVALTQIFTKYVDGQLGALAAALAALLLLPRAQRNGRDWFVALGSTVILLINVKLTGALIAAIVIGGLFIGDRLAVGVVGKSLRPAFGPGAWATVFGAGLIAVFIGWNPYVTQYARNLIEHRAPFYPTDYAELTHLDYNTPESLRGKGSLEKGLISTFSASEGIVTNPYRIKAPFTFSIYELEQFANPDVRLAGFGPWWSGIAILTVAVLALGWRRLSGAAWAIFALLTASVVVNPELWWARYVVQAWALPILALYYTVRYDFTTAGEPTMMRRRVLIALQALLCVALVGNTVLVGVPAVIAQIIGTLRG
jgi:hypothetical protein